MIHRRAGSVLLGAMLQLCPAVSSAQVIAGRVTDAATSAPVPGALVRLVSAEGSILAQVLTNETGAYRISGRTGAQLQLRAEMIGYELWTSTITLSASDTLQLQIPLRVAAIQLAEIRAESGSRCRRIGDLPAVTATLWQDVRTALRIENAVRGAGTLRFELETFEREVAAEGGVVIRDTRRRTVTGSPQPFHSVPIAHLDEIGFFDERADGDFLYAPSPAVLLDDWFADTHCLALKGVDAERRQLGVWFQPNSQRSQPEIEGTLWLDARTRELRRAEFEYVRLPPRLRAGARGVIDFENIPGGGVIVSRWGIFSSIIQLADVVVFGERRQTERVLAHHQTGGEVVRVMRGRDTVYRALRGAIHGVVFDSANRQPLRGATVSLTGTGYAVLTDSLGRYEIRDLPDGVYQLVYDHPQFELLDYRPQPRRIDLRPGQILEIDLFVRGRAKPGPPTRAATRPMDRRSPPLAWAAPLRS